nr:hypothetical protein [Tanacetum cinerariifolium]
MHMADMCASKGSSHVHYNTFYDPSKHDAQSSQVEIQCPNMLHMYSERQKVLTRKTNFGVNDMLGSGRKRII